MRNSAPSTQYREDEQAGMWGLSTQHLRHSGWVDKNVKDSAHSIQYKADWAGRHVRDSAQHCLRTGERGWVQRTLLRAKRMTSPGPCCSGPAHMLPCEEV